MRGWCWWWSVARWRILGQYGGEKLHKKKLQCAQYITPSDDLGKKNLQEAGLLFFCWFFCNTIV